MSLLDSRPHKNKNLWTLFYVSISRLWSCRFPSFLSTPFISNRIAGMLTQAVQQFVRVHTFEAVAFRRFCLLNYWNLVRWLLESGMVILSLLCMQSWGPSPSLLHCRGMFSSSWNILVTLLCALFTISMAVLTSGCLSQLCWVCEKAMPADGEQPGLVEDVPAHGRGLGTRWSLRSLPTQTILWFYSMILCYFSSSVSTKGTGCLWQLE